MNPTPGIPPAQPPLKASRTTAAPLPRGLPAWLGPLHRRVAAGVARLPARPPSWIAARLLDRLLWPRLPEDARAALQGRVVLLQVSDFGLRVALRTGPQGFGAAAEGEAPALRIRATAEAFVRLARGEDDPDRLFFERDLLIEGDTELGLLLKNTLDALGPLLTWPPALPGRRNG